LESALETFRQVLGSAVSNPEGRTTPLAPSPGELRQAAAGLLELGDTTSAIACLENALAQLPAPAPALLRELATAYHLSGTPEQALEILDRAAQLDPHDPALHLFKADLLITLERPQAALACLEHALNLHPNDPDIHQRLALLLRARGQLAAALAHAERMAATVTGPAARSPQAAAARALAADLARALLQPDRAREILGEGLSFDKEQPGEQKPALSNPASLRPPSPAEYFCLSAELALELNEEVAAAAALTGASELDPELARIQALQARFAYRRGDTAAALQSLQSALETIGAAPDHFPETLNPEPVSQDLQGVAAAALELAQWDVALYLLRRAATNAPLEPFGHLELARALVLRAEYQRLCQSLEVLAHAPGSVAITEHAFQSFKNSLQAALRCLPGEFPQLSALETPTGLGSQPLPPPAILRWRARGQAVFQPDQPSLETLRTLVDQPEDRAATISALSNTGDLVAIAQLYKNSRERGTPEPAVVLAQFALSLGFKGRRQEDLGEAVAAARAAVDRQPNQPLYHALHARLAQAVADETTALQSIQTALSLWPEEPRWHALAASFQMAAGDAPAAINHLGKATTLEPRHLPHHLALGEAYLQVGDSHHAIRALEHAVRIAPKQIEPYLALAYAYLSHGDVARAAASAESAIAVAPDQIAPWLLRAEIALQLDDPRGAQKRAEAALRLKPDDPASLHLLARTLDKLGRPGDALAVLEKAIPLAPDPLPLLIERVRLLRSHRGPEAALAAWGELAAHYPDEPAVLAPLAQSQAAAGQKEAATRTAQRALRRSAALQPQEQAGLHHLLGRLHWQAGQLDQAIHQLSEATRLAPGEAEAYLDLGSVQQERRQQAMALQTYQKAIAITPKDPRPYYQAGLVLKSTRDYQGAETMLRRAADLAPEDLTIHRQLAAMVALNLVHNRRSLPLDA
jgi:tetratricopeptide (TPR) repeat protein